MALEFTIPGNGASPAQIAADATREAIARHKEEAVLEKKIEEVRLRLKAQGHKRPVEQPTETPCIINAQVLATLDYLKKQLSISGTLETDRIYGLFRIIDEMILERAFMEQELMDWKKRADELMFNEIGRNIRKATLRY